MNQAKGNWGGAVSDPRLQGKGRKFEDTAPPGTQDYFSDALYEQAYNPGVRGMEPPAQKFVRTEQNIQNMQPAQDQYTAYYDNWDSGYYGESGMNQDVNQQYVGYGYEQQSVAKNNFTNNQGMQGNQFSGNNQFSQSEDFSQDFGMSTESNFSKVYNKNQQNWNKRGGGQGRGGGQNRGGQNRGGGRGGRGQDRGRGRGGGRGRGNQNNNIQGQGRGGFQGNKRGFGQQKPGMPAQKVFSNLDRGQNKRGGGRGRGRGGGGGGLVAPVHSLATVVTPDVSTMSLAEKVRRFCLFLNSDTTKVNSIQTIENALSGSKLGLKTEYEDEELMRIAGRWMFTGCLKLGGVFLSRAVGARKKEIKHECYNKALETLKTKTVAEIFAMKDPGVDAIREELNASIESKAEPVGKVESLAIAKQSVDAMTSKTTSEDYLGFEKLVAYLRDCTNLPESRISCIEQGMTASHCGLQHVYDSQAIRLPTGKLFFKGTLTIAGFLVASGIGCKKKDAKVETYEKGLEALKTKTIHQLMQNVQEADPPASLVQAANATGSGKSVSLPEKDRRNQSIHDKMVEMTELIKEAQFRENNINTMDVTAIHIGFTPTCIYKKMNHDAGTKPMILCDLYLDNILIATGEGITRKEAQVEAYNSGWEVLCTVSADYILKEHKRLKPEDGEDPNVMDVWVKGTGKQTANNNIAGLKRNKLDPNESWRTVDTMVIMEHEDWSFDRQRQAFCILNYSATHNGLLMQWKIEPDDNLFKCTLTLQDKVVGEAFALGKNTSRNLAAANALFRLYETQDVVKISHRDDTKLWISYKDIEQQADELKAASGEPEPEEVVKPEENTEGENNTDKAATTTTSVVNKWVLKVAEKLIEDHKAKETTSELLFGPGMPLAESKEIRQIARNLDLRQDVRQQDGHSYLAVYLKMKPQDVVKSLKRGDSIGGRFSLVARELLPGFDDIREELEKHAALRHTTDSTKKSKIIANLRQDVLGQTRALDVTKTEPTGAGYNIEGSFFKR